LRFYIKALYNEIYFEFSLPKIIYGTNAYNLFAHTKAFETTFKIISQYLGLSIPTFQDISILRFDLAYNFVVNEIGEVLKKISHLEYPRRKKQMYGTSIYWSGINTTLKFYDKIAELFHTKYEQIHEYIKKYQNVLRFEITYKSRGVKRITGKKKPSLHDILQLNYAEIINAELNKFNLVKNIHMSDHLIVTYIQNLFPKRKANNLLKFFYLWREDEFMAKQCYGNNFYTYRKQLQAINISPVSTFDEDLALCVPLSKTTNTQDLQTA